MDLWARDMFQSETGFSRIACCVLAGPCSPMLSVALVRKGNILARDAEA